MKPPRVYRSITAVSADLARCGVGKNHRNADDRYDYRSIDDLLDRISPLLVKHRLCVLPRTLERTLSQRADKNGTIVSSVTVRVAFDLISSFDASSHSVETYGEAMDVSDKATAKAMSAAYKTAMFQTFCIPLSGVPDPDAVTIRADKGAHLPEPAQGWDQWTTDFLDMIAGCISAEAIGRLQSTYRGLLQSLSRERRALYDTIGDAVGSRIKELDQPTSGPSEPRPARPNTKGKAELALADA